MTSPWRIRQRSPAVRRTSFANLVYQVAFTGMENTIVFLTLALFAYSPRDNAWLFLFNGACMIFAQGLARQLVKRLGQRKVVMLGMLIAAVAFVWVALIPPTLAAEGSGAKTSFYLGLGLISFATGLILPSVSALVSLYSDASEQGRNLGILRSAGSLARVIGPGFPSPTGIRSTERIGVSSAAVPVKNSSSAT